MAQSPRVPTPSVAYHGRQVPANIVAALTAAHEGKPLAALVGNPQTILDRLESGESAYEIAADIGVSDTALYSWLIRTCPQEWQAISAARQLSRIDISEREIDQSGDNIGISRARERAKIAQWHLERANRKLFGDTKQIDINQSVTQELRIISDPGGALARRLQLESESIVIDAVIEDPPDTVSD